MSKMEDVFVTPLRDNFLKVNYMKHLMINRKWCLVKDDFFIIPRKFAEEIVDACKKTSDVSS